MTQFTAQFGGNTLEAFRELQRAIPTRLQNACDFQAHACLFDALSEIHSDGLVQTGALAASGYTLSSTENTYPQASSEARGLGAKVTPQPRVPPRPGAVVGFCARHARPVNDGYTHNRGGNHIAARPFFSRAVALSAQQFPETIRQALEGTLRDLSRE